MTIFTRYFLAIFLLVSLILSLVAATQLINSSRIMDEMGATSAETMSKAFYDQAEKQGQNLAGVVAEALVTPVMLREYEAMWEILNAAKAQKQIKFTYVYDDSARIIHDGTETLKTRGKPLTAVIGVTDPFSAQVVWAKEENLLYCLAPIKVENTRLGGVCIALPLQNINESVDSLQDDLAVIIALAVKKNIRDLVYVGGFLLLISLGISYLLARHLTMPISDLVRVVDRIGRGRENALLSAERSDEIGELARALGKLSHDLKETTVGRDHFRRVLDSMPDGVFVTDSHGVVKMVNQAGIRLLDIAEDQVTGKSVSDILPLEGTGKSLNELIASEGHQGFEIVLAGEEKSIPCLGSASNIVREKGKIEGSVLVLHDITNRKEAEQTIAAQRERLAVTLRSIGDGVITTNTEGRVMLMNRMAEKMTGYSQIEAFDKPLTDVFHIVDEDTELPRKNPVKKAVTMGEVVPLEENTMLIGRHGRKVSIADSCAPIRSGQGDIMGAVLVFSDVTEKKKLFQESLKAEKLESLGMLAGGIAHDFNNILTAILGNISFLRLKHQADEEALSKLTLAEKATLKARSLTQQLLTFSKGGAPVTTTASIEDLISETVQFALQGANVKAKFDFEAPLWPVKVDMGQISQVMNNLVFNAVQSMPKGGKLFVSATNVTIASDSRLPLAPGKYVRVEVMDQGTGILKDNLTKIFDPYFTTKDMGHGLGLTTTYYIIKKHNGHIHIDSEEGQGTTVTFYLPSSDKKLDSEHTEKPMPSQGHGKLLYMDDDPMILDITGKLLFLLGYSATPAENGQEALALFEEAGKNNDPFDLVILDLTIPGGMGGKETMKKLLELDPDVKAIVASGYSNDPIMANFKDHGFKGVIAKPYTVEKMQQLLHEVLMKNTEETL